MTGYQWLNGSFTEDVESTQTRAPGDIDVITFLFPPSHLTSPPNLLDTLVAANSEVFQAQQSKIAYKVDAYFVGAYLGGYTLIRQTAYWFGLFSHRREDSVWKGLLEIELHGAVDTTAARTLLGSR